MSETTEMQNSVEIHIRMDGEDPIDLVDAAEDLLVGNHVPEEILNDGRFRTDALEGLGMSWDDMGWKVDQVDTPWPG